MLLNFNPSGYNIQIEPLLVKSGTLHLLHDNFNTLTMYSDIEKTLVINQSNYIISDELVIKLNESENQTVYNSIAFDSEFITLHNLETVYVDYVTYGDEVDQEDINKKSDKIVYYQCGENIGQKRAVYLLNDKIYMQSSDDINFRFNILGLTLYQGVENEIIGIQIKDVIFEDTWNFDLAKDIFLGTNGNITQTPSLTGGIVRIGYPISTNRLMLEKTFVIFN